MTETYLNRKKQNDPKNDEIKIGSRPIEEKLNQPSEIQDATKPKEQNTSLDSKKEDKLTNWDKTKDATRNALDRAGNTSQYMKYVNDHFEKQHSEINRIKQLQEKFDQEVNLLQNDNSNNASNTLDQKKNSDKRDLYSLQHSLLEEKTTKVAHLNQLKDEISRTEKNLQKIDEELQDVERRLVD